VVLYNNPFSMADVEARDESLSPWHLDLVVEMAVEFGQFWRGEARKLVSLPKSTRLLREVPQNGMHSFAR